MAMSVFIGLGSNLREPEQQIRKAIAALKHLPETSLSDVAPAYRSEPMGPADQPDYINTVARIETGLGPRELMEHLQSIERAQGRTRNGERWGPRTLDLDILVFGDEVIDGPDLIVPHPGISEREFVLYPLNDIASGLEIPDLGRVSELRQDCPSRGIEKLEISLI